MIVKTQGILLRMAPMSASSRLATWMTPDAGRTTTLIKGSQRPKSFFLGQYDLFYTCEILFYARGRGSLPLARECYPLKTRRALRCDWKAAAAASYFCDVVARICPPDAPHPEVFDLLDRSLDHLAEAGATPALLLWFELQLLQEMGLAPRLHNCLACNGPLEPGDARSRFSYARGGILCARCTRQTDASGVPLAADTLAALRGWQAAHDPGTTRDARCSLLQLQEMEQLLGSFLAYHLELPLLSREIARDVLSRRLARA